MINCPPLDPKQFNPLLSPKSDQHQFSPNKINTDHQEKRLWEFIK